MVLVKLNNLTVMQKAVFGYVKERSILGTALLDHNPWQWNLSQTAQKVPVLNWISVQSVHHPTPVPTNPTLVHGPWLFLANPVLLLAV